MIDRVAGVCGIERFGSEHSDELLEILSDEAEHEALRAKALANARRFSWDLTAPEIRTQLAPARR